MTYTVMGRCKDTGKIGYAVATGSIACGAFLPALTRKGDLIISQAFARPELGHEAAALLDEGVPLQDISAELDAGDEFYRYRQLAVLTLDGQTFVHTGESAMDWKGHAADDTCVSVGNALAGEHVAVAMLESFQGSEGQELSGRLLSALEAGRDAGGQSSDRDPQARYPELSSQVWVSEPGCHPEINLRVDFDLEAIYKLRRLYEGYGTLGYRLRADDPPEYIRQYVRYDDGLEVSPEWIIYRAQI